MPELTPVHLRNGRWYKREDLFTVPAGVNGAKLRACQHLIGVGVAAGAQHVVSAASVLSPQNAMAAVTAAGYGLRCTVILGGTRPDSAIKHPAVRIAAAAGAEFRYVPVGYNPYLQKTAAAVAADIPRSYWLRYGITCPPDATAADMRAFLQVGADQVQNLPPQVRTLVLPFGSGNTAAGVLLGLTQYPHQVEKVILVGIGPDRRAWLQQRLTQVGVPGYPLPTEHVDLHGSGYASYGDRMPATADGIVMHPTYEGKVVRYLDEKQPSWWVRRDGSCCLWIVGGPLTP